MRMEFRKYWYIDTFSVPLKLLYTMIKLAEIKKNRLIISVLFVATALWFEPDGWCLDVTN